MCSQEFILTPRFVYTFNLQIHQISTFGSWFVHKFVDKIHKILKYHDFVPIVDDVWEAAKVAWSNITPVDIEVLFRT